MKSKKKFRYLAPLSSKERGRGVRLYDLPPRSDTHRSTPPKNRRGAKVSPLSKWRGDGGEVKLKKNFV